MLTAGQKLDYLDQKLSMSEDDHQQAYYSQPLASHTNGAYSSSQSNTMDSQRRYYDYEPRHAAKGPERELHRKRSDLATNGNNSEFAGVFQKNATGSKRTAQKKDKKRKNTFDVELDEIEKQDAYWIHRDKLKEIETRELEEAGYAVGRSSRSNSRSRSQTRHRSRKNSGEVADSLDADDHGTHRRMVSTIPDEEPVREEQHMWDSRTSEEVAAEREAWASRNNHSTPRPGTSRIPIAKSTPAPVPSSFVERDAPLPRSRSGSVNWGVEGLAERGARVRSGSVSSQVLLNDVAAALEPQAKSPAQTTSSKSTPAKTPSAQKAKAPAKTPVSGVRKTSTQQRSTSTPQTRGRNTSNNTSAKRPGTSSGSLSRPVTARPEGEAPWIATMYKPDPRLPPDQQIIPTHAKRMQQEQWEQEGKPGTIYDREFRPLNTEDAFPNKRASQIQPLDLSIEQPPQNSPDWPLPSPTKASPEQRPGTNMKSPTNEGGNYKLTPTIPPTNPQAPSRAASRTSLHPAPTNTSVKQEGNVVRQPEPPAEKETKKGCCCIVM